jgi:hypothetical protein
MGCTANAPVGTPVFVFVCEMRSRSLFDAACAT